MTTNPFSAFRAWGTLLLVATLLAACGNSKPAEPVVDGPLVDTTTTTDDYFVPPTDTAHAAEDVAVTYDTATTKPSAPTTSAQRKERRQTPWDDGYWSGYEDGFDDAHHHLNPRESYDADALNSYRVAAKRKQYRKGYRKGYYDGYEDGVEQAYDNDMDDEELDDDY